MVIEKGILNCKKGISNRVQWHTPDILATQETEAEDILSATDQGQPQ